MKVIILSMLLVGGCAEGQQLQPWFVGPPSLQLVPVDYYSSRLQTTPRKRSMPEQQRFYYPQPGKAILDEMSGSSIDSEEDNKLGEVADKLRDLQRTLDRKRRPYGSKIDPPIEDPAAGIDIERVR